MRVDIVFVQEVLFTAQKDQSSMENVVSATGDEGSLCRKTNNCQGNVFSLNIMIKTYCAGSNNFSTICVYS